MSSEALQRTVRRVGAVVVLAVGALAMTFQRYVEYTGYPLGVWEEVALVLTYGAFLYLVGSLLLGAAAKLEGSVQADPVEGDEQGVEDAE